MFLLYLEQTRNVGPGLVGNGNDRVGHFQSGLFYPKRKIVTATELFAFPRTQRLERMHRNDKWNAVILSRQNSTPVGIPGVTVHDLGIDAGGIKIDAASHCAQSRSKRF